MNRLGIFAVLVGLTLGGCGGKGDVRSIAVTPATASVSTGETSAFTATATWSNDSTSDVTAEATWGSSDTAVATVDAAGLATGVASGAADIDAVFEGVTGTAILTVAGSQTVVSIAVTPAGPLTLIPGATEALVATATYDDGGTANISGSATWTSSEITVATVADGFVTAVADGTTQVMASVGTVYSNNVSITVGTQVILSSIAITPAMNTIDVGETLQYTATGTYSDTSSADISGTVTWDSSATAVAGIDAAGLASGLSTGTTQITASLSGVTSNSADLEVVVAVPAPGVGDLVINEFLVDGSQNQDANGDGTTDATEDEFLEIVNVSGVVVDLEGVVIKENQFPGLPRHTFGMLRLADGEAVVVFGGGGAPADATGVTYRIANAPDPGIAFGLALSDTGDTVTLEAADGTVITTLSWGGATGLDANLDESLTLDPDVTGTVYGPHTTATGSGGAIFSPGTKVNGSNFP